MSLVRRNIAANLLGAVFITVLTIVMTPMQVKILGIEAYGIVGFISTLQIAFTAFDFGLSSTLTREIAADKSADKHSSNDLVRTASTIYWIAALVLGVLLYFAAGAIAERWFKASHLGIALIERSLQVVAVYLALRWPVALYSGLLSGLQRMDVLNAVKVLTSSLRLVGGIAVLAYWRNLYAFLIWTSLMALVEVITFAAALRRIHPSMTMRPGISVPALARIWKFSASMNALAILAVLIVQLDRLLISKMLTLKELGYYSLAYTAAAGISFVVAAISSAVLPSLAAAHGSGVPGSVLDGYRKADRAMLVLSGAAAFALMFYGDVVLAMWVNSDAAVHATTALVLLAAGFWCSAVIANVYNVAIASGSPGTHLRVNIVSVGPYAVALYLLIKAFGINGAAAGWLLLNLAYAILVVPVIHRQILEISTRRWLLETIVPFTGLAFGCFAGPRLAVQFYSGNAQIAFHAGALAASLALYGAANYVVLKGGLRDIGFVRARRSGIEI